MKNDLIANNSEMKLSTHTGIHVDAHDLAFRISPSKVRPCYLLSVPHIATSDLVRDELVASTINSPMGRPPLLVGFLKQALKALKTSPP
ncbi:hypothetical protein ACFX15_012778 [Malus domestica]